MSPKEVSSVWKGGGPVDRSLGPGVVTTPAATSKVFDRVN